MIFRFRPSDVVRCSVLIRRQLQMKLMRKKVKKSFHYVDLFACNVIIINIVLLAAKTFFISF